MATFSFSINEIANHHSACSEELSRILLKRACSYQIVLASASVILWSLPNLFVRNKLRLNNHDERNLLPPPVLWAQNRDDVFLTFNIECKDPDIKIEKSSVYFKGVNVRDNKIYEVKIPLHDAVEPEKSNFVNKGRCIEMVVPKAIKTTKFWPSLTSDKKKPHYLKIDFNKWCDEDDEQPENAGDNEALNFSKMLQSMGSDVGTGDKKPSFDDLESDSDDETLPDLE